MSLFDGLHIASRALQAQEFGLNITGQNIANLNTDGYVRRTVQLAEVAPSDRFSPGGVEVIGARAQRDAYIEARLQTEIPNEQLEGAIADSLAIVETTLGQAGSSIDGRLTAFFDAYSALAQDPMSPVARDGVLLQGRLLTGAFNDMSHRFDDAMDATDSQVRGSVDEINRLAQQIASLNQSIGGANGLDVESLNDQQTLALHALAGIAGVTALQRQDGGIDVSIGNGRALVAGANAYALTIRPEAVTGQATIFAGDSDITGELTGGRVGGLLQVRETMLPAYKTQLDQLAAAVVQSVNAAHAAGYGLRGSTTVNFFAPLAAMSGAAAAIAVNAAVAGNPDLVAASATGTAGDNQTAKTIAGLRDVKTVGGTATFIDAWGQLVYQVGSDAQTAQTNQQVRHNVVAAVQRLRDSVSGVSLDEEAATMMKFQRAYEANAKYFATINGVLDTLLNLI